jgi:hypothetical protein
MKVFSLSHDIATDVDGFWKLFFDKDYNVALYAKGLGFPAYELISLKETDKEISRTVKVTPKLDVPGPVAKLLGSGFAYTEEGTFDRASKLWRWRNTPSDKLRTEGTIRAEPAGEGRMRRVGEVTVEGKLFGLSSVLESTLEKNLRNGWDGSARFMNEWLAGKHR